MIGATCGGIQFFRFQWKIFSSYHACKGGGKKVHFLNSMHTFVVVTLFLSWHINNMKPFNENIFHKLCCPCVILYIKKACKLLKNM